VTKGELVEVDLKLGATDAMMGPDEPLLKIADRAIRERHDGGDTFAKVFAHRLAARHVVEAGDPASR